MIRNLFDNMRYGSKCIISQKYTVSLDDFSHVVVGYFPSIPLDFLCIICSFIYIKLILLANHIYSHSDSRKNYLRNLPSLSSACELVLVLTNRYTSNFKSMDDRELFIFLVGR